MLKYILSYETNLFFLINGSHTHWADCFLWLYSGSIIWAPIIIFLLIAYMYKKRCTEWLPLLIFIILLFVCCDQISSRLIKPVFERPRPTHYLGIMDYVHTLYGYRGGRYGFISNHAANASGFAMFTALLFRKKIYSIVIFSWAIIMMYSRVYIGVHFVSDVFFGALIGMAIGYLLYKLYCYISNKIYQKRGVNIKAVYTVKRIKIISLTIISYIFICGVLSEFLIIYLCNIRIW